LTGKTSLPSYIYDYFILTLKNLLFIELNTPLQEVPGMPLIGDSAPSIKAKTTKGDINFPEDYKG